MTSEALHTANVPVDQLVVVDGWAGYRLPRMGVMARAATVGLQEREGARSDEA